MGGPFWARRQEHAWSIPKGEAEPGENDLEVARREFAEEIGVAAPGLPYIELGTFRYSSGKTVTVFTAAAPDFEPTELRSNEFELEWPPRSGRMQRFPEFDAARWVPMAKARSLLVIGQLRALDALLSRLSHDANGPITSSSEWICGDSNPETQRVSRQQRSRRSTCAVGGPKRIALEQTHPYSSTA